MSKILIFGDICPTDDTKEVFESGSGESLFGNVLPLIKEADYCIANLECAITDHPTPVKKCGPVLYGSTKCMTTIADAGLKAVSLANNHIRDCGDEGVSSTLDICQQHHIRTFGAGVDEQAASVPLIVEVKGKKIGFASFAEREFNYTKNGKMGAKALDVFEDYDRIRQLKAQVDCVIVLFHGGIENYRYPSPLLRKKCRKFVDSGANVVLVQHSHCIGSYEKYHGGTILYGQGNSIFGYRKGDDKWNESLVLTVSVEDKVSVVFTALETQSNGLVSLSSNPDGIMVPFMERSAKITDTAFIEAEWQKFCNEIEPLYLSMLYGHGLQTNRLNRLLRNMLVRLLYSKWQLNVTNNLVRCDAHREVIETLLNKYNY
ncbi:CapA family protein [Bacteroides thetaiotaomicron]|uniref:CapA family protein n=1 Tax=Bacteroides thetaiotaomicron TaxID=818 RepID=UPI000E4A0DEF|nr:CapA family protein [Bacteroides thetaiotaomicron]RGV64973.1 CapA family protein [Bacteroides thetaiotaomicron]